jgi:hypothetical protein
MQARKKGRKLSESRKKRDEFLTAPHPYASRGEPKAKLLGSFSFGTLLWTEQRAAAVKTGSLDSKPPAVSSTAP